MIIERFKSLYELLNIKDSRKSVESSREELRSALKPLLLIRGRDEYGEEVCELATDIVQTIDALIALQGLLVYQLERMISLTTKKKGAMWRPSLEAVLERVKRSASSAPKKG